MNKKRKKKIFHAFLFWLVFAIITTAAFYYNIKIIKWIDIPTHFAAGMAIAAILFAKGETGHKKAIFTASVFFVSWEFIEVFASNYSTSDFYIRLFEETLFNQIRDLSMDYIGFAAYLLIFEKKARGETVSIDITSDE